ncbi:hypothetical protein BDZ89DRAFT_1176682 [Hymenopellis radicata]|nr:hypothetical protein BDZ89DRAFT_1176682 [Hymenopellis radicata]
MGFLKRFFSLGGKKGRKQKLAESNADDPGLTMDFRYRPPATEEEAEAVANRLLRSSSARYAVVAEIDCSELPPLRNPSHRQSSQNSYGSSSSLRSGSFSRGTYKVTVHQKERYTGSTTSAYGSSNEDAEDVVTPRARRQHLDAQPQDTTAVIRLRSDPSVASLLDLYDEHGRLPDQAFSNSFPSPPATPSKDTMSTVDRPTPSPTQEGRAQCRRNGSTLRQLLGTPSAPKKRDTHETSAFEGDISWAERFLGENASHSESSSITSFGPETPILPNVYESNAEVHTDTTLSSDYDHSTDMIRNRTISSMSVELSSTSDATSVSEGPVPKTYPYEAADPTTPRRASEVFGFLTDKRRSRFVDDFDQPLPEPPSAFSTPSSAHDTPPSRFSTDTSLDAISLNSSNSAIPQSSDTQASDPFTAVSRTHDRPAVALQPASTRIHNSVPKCLYSNAPAEQTEETRKVKVLMTVPTTVMVTAPTPNHQMDRSMSRIPRGPRSSRKADTTRVRKISSSKEQKGLLDRSNSHDSSLNDRFTAIPSRPRKMQPRVSSNSTTSAASSMSQRRNEDKENGLGLTAKTELPFTPLRSGQRSLLRAAVTPGAFVKPEVPSPASSSELSPIGQRVMIETRRQRTNQRQRFGPRDHQS